MHFPLTTTALPIALLAALATAQPGGYYAVVGYKYSGPGCTPQTLINPDPIFGSGGYCQPLDRFGDGAPIVSYKASSIAEGCSCEFSISFVFGQRGKG